MNEFKRFASLKKQLKHAAMSDEMKTGRPRLVCKPKFDTIEITWTVPNVQLDPPISYEVRYKNVSDGKWILHKEHLSDNSLKLENLPSGVRFVFQVRMINDENVGPYSLESDEIETVPSAAIRMFPVLTNVPMINAEIAVKGLPFTEDKQCRNESAKTRKLTLGYDSGCEVNEKTILFLGCTGSGKSTLVDAMINYIFGVSLRDSFRLTVENLEVDEMKNKGNQALSQTMWITCYTIPPIEGTRIPYKLTIIDTPGYGDVRGIEADQVITKQIEKLFDAKDKKGILYLDAVCFVIKASDARLTSTQQYIFDSIFSLFQKDIIDNFCMMVTFSDGNPPEVLSALKADNLPHEQYFSFNNSSLFADSLAADASKVRRALLDWNMGQNSFVKFFEALEKLNSKSLTLSKEVLTERRRIEITVENMQAKLAAAIEMNESLQKQIKLIKDGTESVSTELVGKEKQHTYTVTEIEIAKKSSSTNNLNCQTCKLTCHKKCWSLNVKMFNIKLFIRNCEVFFDGLCTQCDRKCDAECHINEGYEYIYTTKQVTKSYEDIKKMFAAAAEGSLSHEDLIREMEKKMETLSIEIDEMIETITKSKERLKQIALRCDPVSVADQFDAWIKEEETIRNYGWQNRVEGYRKFKKRAQQKDGNKKVVRGDQTKIK